MRLTTLIYCVLIGSLAALNAHAQHPLAFLHGDWEGPGKTSGLIASIRYTWKPALNGKYTTLQLHNRMTGEDGKEIVFEGIGYYQASDNQTLTGVWIDSQGDILPLHATLEGHTLTVTWGTKETKKGRSVYRQLPDGKLEAVNSIEDEQGEWREFGRAILSRTNSKT